MKTNHLVWNIISPEARTNERKMQSIEIADIKASIILAKVAYKLAVLEKEVDDSQKQKLEKIVDECNDSLALIMQTDKWIWQEETS